jgi:hypothetical protein
LHFLLKLNAKVINQLPQFCERMRLYEIVGSVFVHFSGSERTAEGASASGGLSVDRVLGHLYETRYRLAMEHRLAARKEVQRHYVRHHTSPPIVGGVVAVGAHGAGALRTDDANALLNRIAHAPYSAALTQYYDFCTTAMSVPGPLGGAGTAHARPVSWEDLLGWDQISPDAYYASGSDGSSADEEAGGDEEEEEEEVEGGDMGDKKGVGKARASQKVDGFVVTTLDAALLGLSLLSILLQTSAITSENNETIRFQTTEAVRLLVPQVYSAAHLRQLLRPYVLPLLRSSEQQQHSGAPVKTASSEGLRLASLVYLGGIVCPVLTALCCLMSFSVSHTALLTSMWRLLCIVLPHFFHYLRSFIVQLQLPCRMFYHKCKEKKAIRCCCLCLFACLSWQSRRQLLLCTHMCSWHFITACCCRPHCYLLLVGPLQWRGKCTGIV